MGAKQLAKTIGTTAPTAEAIEEIPAAGGAAVPLVLRLKRFAIRRRTLMNLVLGLLMVGLAQGSPLPYAVGLGLLLASQAVRVWAAGYIHKDETLVTNGPFACTRNPLYLSNLVGATGFLLMCGRWEMAPPVLLGWFLLHLPTVATEEEFLRSRFGEKYSDYCRRVPRWLPRWPLVTSLPEFSDKRRFSLRRVLANREHVNILGGWLIAAVFYIEMVK